MGRDGICRVKDGTYSKTIRFNDINYQLAQNEDKNAIFEGWCDFLNYFDSKPYIMCIVICFRGYGERNPHQDCLGT